ncbi:MAG TPA: hypothetical protein VGK67_20345 [Myxococcales bacterium]|jgi:hypothetical protein
MNLEKTTNPPSAAPQPDAAGPRVRLMVHEGRQVVLIDGSRLAVEPAKAVFVAARAVVARHAPKSALTLTDVTGMLFDDALVSVVRETIAADEPYVKAAAVVGITGLKKIVINTLVLLTGRPLRTFDTRERALAWLVQQV